MADVDMEKLRVAATEIIAKVVEEDKQATVICSADRRVAGSASERT